MKIILFLVILSVASANSCNDRKKAENKQNEITESESVKTMLSSNEYFIFLEATSQEWVAGIRGGGRGIDYFFKMEIVTDQKLQFEKAWMKNRAYELFVSKETPGISSQPVTFSKGDVIIVRASEVHYEQTISQGFIEEEPPVTFKGDALIGFLSGGELHFFEVEKITELEPSYRP